MMMMKVEQKANHIDNPQTLVILIMNLMNQILCDPL